MGNIKKSIEEPSRPSARNAKTTATHESGAQDIDPAKIQSKTFRKFLYTEKQRRPDHTYVEIVNSIVLTGRSFCGQARKLLRQHSIASENVSQQAHVPDQEAKQPAKSKQVVAGKKRSSAQSVVSLTDDDDKNSSSDSELAPHLYGQLKKEEVRDSRAASWKSINQPASQPDEDSDSFSGGADFNGRIKSQSPLVLFGHLTPDLQELQTEYFGIKDPTTPIICMVCGARGHLPEHCQSGTCPTCSGQHSGAHCRQNRKCRRCRERGHTGEQCENRPVQAGLPGDECDLCGKGGHAEEECARLWCTFDPALAKTISSKRMQAWCYKCGGRHWGDDCPHLSREVRQRTAFSSTFSKANAAKFINSEEEDDEMSREPQNGPSLPAYQLGMVADW